MEEGMSYTMPSSLGQLKVIRVKTKIILDENYEIDYKKSKLFRKPTPYDKPMEYREDMGYLIKLHWYKKPFRNSKFFKFKASKYLAKDLFNRSIDPKEENEIFDYGIDSNNIFKRSASGVYRKQPRRI